MGTEKNKISENIDTEKQKNEEYLTYRDEQKAKKKHFKKMIKFKKQQEKKEILAFEAKNKEKNKNDPERKNRFKRLFFGVGKEFWRVTWPKKKEMLNSFISVIVITLILAGILTGITFLITTFVN